ncbi:spermidine synthase [Brevundimonas sp. Leaf168]|uniref:spermidine synthase n=1 Tax=Brevundimonas sp. Leaf168 TaxID=1736283 RepID=UPI0007022A2C|nr:fused MFS/spermidine synthase [Brevundimonas sp. Leaf168]KQR61656.1 spermidine synthase [Brevundimonas sp. Leaf168]
MTEAVDPLRPAAPTSDRIAPILFAVAIFTSACLVFVVQPMAAKLLLPTLGGSPSVWNASMVFFQTALLAGYGYAHLLQRLATMRAQVGVHLGLLIVAAFFLPLQISGLLGDPDPSQPAMWLLATLAVSIGAPFAVLSATAPLLQAWYARVRAGHADGQNPYVLYAASNLGSFLALLAYPVVIEPLASLPDQRLGWSVGYGLFVVMVVGLGVQVWRRREIGTAEPAPLEASPPIAWREKGMLVLLAAAPSSLMLGVTAHLTTDVASAPFLWVIPLALYLLTFVIAFQTRPAISPAIGLGLQAAAAAACAALIAFRTGEWLLVFTVNLAAFFFTALMCHQRLAARRPAPDRLTEFYLLLSLGGVVGGLFNGLIAPAVFDMVWEYPLVLVAVGLLRPWSRREIRPWEIICCVAGVVIALLGPLSMEAVRYAPDIRAAIPDAELVRIAQAILGIATLFAFLVRDRAVMFTIVLAAIVWSGYHLARGYDWALSERSFFGVMRVANIDDPLMGGPVHVLMHGTTLHGAQAQAPSNRCQPTLYYATSTPLGQAMLQMQTRRLDGARVGVVGQGSGAMAAYKRAQDQLTFFEIDPMVDRLSRDPKWFSFIKGCADGPVRTVLGDARLTMDREPSGSYDLLVIDAFSSDAVPTHLLTVEAIRGYLRLLAPDGVVVLHLSNRNLEITLPAEAAAQALKVPHLHQVYIEQSGQGDMAEASTEALLIGKSPAALEGFRDDARWRKLSPTTVRPWTDDYVNLFGSLVRQMKMAAR